MPIRCVACWWWWAAALAELVCTAASPLDVGRVLLSQGRFGDAFRVFRDGLAASPQDHALANAAGVALRKQRLDAEAYQYYQRSLAIKPDFDVAHNSLCRLHFAADRASPDATYHCEQAASRDSAYLDPQLTLIKLYRFQNRPLESAAVAQRALSQHPLNLGLLRTVSASMLELGNFQEASKHLTQAFALSSKTAFLLASTTLPPPYYWGSVGRLRRAARQSMVVLRSIQIQGLNSHDPLRELALPLARLCGYGVDGLALRRELHAAVATIPLLQVQVQPSYTTHRERGRSRERGAGEGGGDGGEFERERERESERERGRERESARERERAGERERGE
jgi:tetratricopeptide (TPR) repeat protein